MHGVFAEVFMRITHRPFYPYSHAYVLCTVHIGFPVCANQSIVFFEWKIIRGKLEFPSLPVFPENIGTSASLWFKG